MLYPGRADHPQAALAERQMEAGGTMLAFEVAGGKAAAFRVANALSIIGISNNLGDAKSLITHPETTTHQRLKPEQRAALGIGPGLLRLSVGLEDAEDLIEDLRAGARQGGRAAASRGRIADGTGGAIAPPGRPRSRLSSSRSARVGMRPLGVRWLISCGRTVASWFSNSCWLMPVRWARSLSVFWPSAEPSCPGWIG